MVQESLSVRDPKRIHRILFALKKFWERNPDLRLSQIIGNIHGPGDAYNMEDTVVEAWIVEENEKAKILSDS